MESDIRKLTKDFEKKAKESLSMHYAMFPENLPDRKQLKKLLKATEILISRWEFYDSCMAENKKKKISK